MERSKQGQAERKRRKESAGEGGGEVDAKRAGDPFPSQNAKTVKDILFQKYETSVILVESLQGSKPKKVYFVKCEDKELLNEETVDKDDYFTITYHQCEGTESPKAAKNGVLEFLNKEWMEKWSSTISLNRNYQDVLSLLGLLEDVLRFNTISSRWHSTNEALNDCIAKSLKICSENHEVDRNYNFGAIALVDGFTRRMTNASGQDVLRIIVQLANLVCFGGQQGENQLVATFNSGSAEKKHGQFPGDQSPSEFYRYVIPDYVRAVKKSSVKSGDAGSVADSIMLNPTRGVNADVVAVSGYQPNFPHFILVGQVKSCSDYCRFPFDESAERQFICELLEPMLNQTYVLGVLFSDMGARLFDVQMNFSERRIKVTAKDYHFRNPWTTDFNSENLKMLFRDLIFGIEYTKERTQKIQHWPEEMTDSLDYHGSW